MTTYRVVQWSTGNVGRHAIAGIDARPDLSLAGVWVSTVDKVGRDAGELAGLGRVLGVKATNDADELLALRPDCVVYTAMADDRLGEAIEDLTRILRAGINVVSSSPVFLQFPDGVIPEEMIEPIRRAAAEGGASLWVNGVDPGFANDWLPLVLTGVCQRIDEVRCLEILDYSTYDNAKVLFDIMGFGKPLADKPLLLQPGVLSLAWGSVVRQLAAGLGVTFDRVEESFERLPAPETFAIASGRIASGTAAALRFEVRGMVGERAVCVLEHVTRLRPDLGPDWPQPTGQGCYRVQVTGYPSMIAVRAGKCPDFGTSLPKRGSAYGCGKSRRQRSRITQHLCSESEFRGLSRRWRVISVKIAVVGSTRPKMSVSFPR